MTCFSGLVIGLSFIFGCILLGLVGEIYYLFWWKRRITTSRQIQAHHTSYAKKLSHLFFWRKPNSPLIGKTPESAGSATNLASNGYETDPELGSANGNFLGKGFGEEGVESEIMRLHNLCGPPRFLFTIKEETREDLESDDGKSRGDRSRRGSRTRSLSDFLVAVETPNLTPLASPTLKAHPLDSYSHHGFNPLFESFTEAELNRLRSSPPPKFKFLRDAEEKLVRKLMEEAEKRGFKHGGYIQDSVVKAPPSEEKEGSFIQIIVGKNKEREAHPQQFPQYQSSASQVLPLSSSPSTFKLQTTS
ncbi:uncharacterized protein LOC127796291 [Diospyros lotus]|uniref:uncharacterized protein LOC127796291 n=1 Tax=Diospyros lotus TaxID=55363 RepID=UPI002255F650|nr:uncharacterized protein LOC127796291 [Diospyros lotus]